LFGSTEFIVPDVILTLIEPVYSIFVLGFRPKKQWLLVALLTP